VICDGLEVLHDGREMELVARTGEAAQTHALEAVVNLQVGKTHLNFLALVVRLFKLRGPSVSGHDHALLR
jgi:hypothetical protein